MSTAGVILAAGLGSRYRAGGGVGASKLVAEIAGVPLVRRVAEAAGAAGLEPVVVVTGHARREVEAALAGLPVRLVRNPDYATGLASSLRTGIAAVPPGASRAIVLLGDMPLVTAESIRRLVAAAEAAPDQNAVVPTVAGRRGNPVVLSRSLFPAVARLDGDAGARTLLRDPAVSVLEVAIDAAALTLDIDEPADLARAEGAGPAGVASRITG